MEPDAALTAGTAVALGALTRRLVAPNAGLMTGPGTNTYLLGTTMQVVLDPGPDDDAHLQAILESSTAPIRWIVVTHTHRDHSPLPRRLVQATGALVIGLPAPADGRQDTTFAPTHVPRDRERLQLGEVDLIAIHTPGHASNCVCYLLDGERLLFTGDHVLEGVSPVILPPDGSMSDYVSSLDKVLELDFDWIAPGHGRLMSAGKDVVRALRAHRMRREAKVIEGLRRSGPAVLERLTTAVYDDVAPQLHVWAALTLEAHLIKLEQEGRALRRGALWSIAGE